MADALVEGATEEDVVAVLVCLAPVVGTARVIQAAPEVALALGYDVESALEGLSAARPEHGSTAHGRERRKEE